MGQETILYFSPSGLVSAFLAPDKRSALSRVSASLFLFLKSWRNDTDEHAPRCALSVIAFIPSAGGISRSPCEFSKPENLAKGADAIFKRILKIDQGYLQQHG
jgi:hypothetical protein